MAFAPDGKCWTWGKYVTTHKIAAAGSDASRYEIVEFLNKDNQTVFLAYVNGKDTNVGSYSIEGALLIAFAYHFNDKRVDAAKYAAQLLGVRQD